MRYIVCDGDVITPTQKDTNHETKRERTKSELVLGASYTPNLIYVTEGLCGLCSARAYCSII